MKTIIILFLAVSALITLSFTFRSVVSVNSHAVKALPTYSSKYIQAGPIGGFASEDKL